MAGPEPKTRRRAQARSQRGVTLVELMIAMVISSLLLGMTFSIYTRMSVAYRGQTVITELQQTLRAANDFIGREIRQTGYLITSFRTATGAFGTTTATELPPYFIGNNVYGEAPNPGPDHLRVYYADANAFAMVKSVDSATQITVVDATEPAFKQFDPADNPVVVLIAQELWDRPPGSVDIIKYRACVLQITSIVDDVVSFDASGNYNVAGNPQCVGDDWPFGDGTVWPYTGGEVEEGVMMARFVGRSFRIDSARRDVGVLQWSPSGELIANDWEDLGIGFTDLQIASRRLDVGDGTNEDQALTGDLDPERDWFSGNLQNTSLILPTYSADAIETQVLLNIALSIAVRTPHEVSGVTSSQTPDLTNAIAPNNNMIGDSPTISLAVPDQSTLPIQHQGDYIYRWSHNVIDVRNVGVGQ